MRSFRTTTGKPEKAPTPPAVLALDSWQEVDPASLQAEHLYLLDLSEGFGCGGTDGHVTLSSTRSWVLDEYEQAVKAARLAQSAQDKAARQAALEQAGLAPRWDENWTGTRAEFDAAYKAWSTRTNELETLLGASGYRMRQGVARMLVRDQGMRLLGSDLGIDVINQPEDAAYPVSALAALGEHIEQGCRCLCSSRWLDDSENIKEDLGLSVDDTWPESYPGARWISPAATLVTFGSWQVLAAGHLDQSSAADLLVQAHRAWLAACEVDRSKAAAFQEELNGLYDQERLAQAGFAEYEQHKADSNRIWSVKHNLNSYRDPARRAGKVQKEAGILVL